MIRERLHIRSFLKSFQLLASVVLHLLNLQAINAFPLRLKLLNLTRSVRFFLLLIMPPKLEGFLRFDMLIGSSIGNQKGIGSSICLMSGVKYGLRLMTGGPMRRTGNLRQSRQQSAINERIWASKFGLDSSLGLN